MRSLRLATGIAVMLCVAAVPALAAHANAPIIRSVLTKRVARPGQYTVLVSIPSTSVSQTVKVFAGSQVQTDVDLGPGLPEELAFFLRLKTRTLKVRVVGSGPHVHFTVASESAAASVAAPSTGPYTNLAFSDDFTGTAGTAPNPSNWSPDPNAGTGCGAGTLSYNTPDLANASLDGQGNAAITALQDPSNANGTPYTSAQIDTNSHYTFTYGRIEARMELPTGSGLCNAFWLLQAPPPGDTSCAAPCNEVDIVEQISPYPEVAFADLHGPTLATSNYQQFQGGLQAATPLTGAFHTWGLIWAPGRITWTLDGLPYATATPASLSPTSQWMFDGASMRIIFDLAVGGWPGAPANAAGFPATMRVDWVRVYQ
jgi:beta-glucanase (GH16 family)